MKKLVIGATIGLVALFGLSSCATLNDVNLQTQFRAACDRVDGITRAVQVLVDAGELTPTQIAQYEDAKNTVAVVCSQTFPRDVNEALYTTATVYVTLAAILRD